MISGALQVIIESLLIAASDQEHVHCILIAHNPLRYGQAGPHHSVNHGWIVWLHSTVASPWNQRPAGSKHTCHCHFDFTADASKRVGKWKNYKFGASDKVPRPGLYIESRKAHLTAHGRKFVPDQPSSC